MNPFEFVIAILFLTFAFSIIRHKMGMQSRSLRDVRGGPVETEETLRLRGEVEELKERIKVLERITVEKENSLAREIESLRDR
jgi:hypothetical protein